MAGKRFDPKKLIPLGQRFEDVKPWFVCALYRPPAWREVRILWPDGARSLGSWSGEKWSHYYQEQPDLRRRTADPVGWQPLVIEAHRADETMDRLPDPLLYGLQIK